jgi:hypothetical protein
MDDFTITWKNLEDPSLIENGYVIETDYYVNANEHPHYNGATPNGNGQQFVGWYIEG